jgi:RNA polymerase sigma factor (sigma-70 family)
MQVDLYSEAEIAKGCQQNDRFFQEILYRRYARKMYGICLSYAGNRSLAQDMLHEAFMKIYKGIGDFRASGSLEGWVRRTVTHTAIDHLRQMKRIGSFIDDKQVIPDTTTEESALDALNAKDILKQVARLPEGARVVFNLFALEGFTHKEIAQELSISEGTSKSQYSRARTLLMSWIKDTNT